MTQEETDYLLAIRQEQLLFAKKITGYQKIGRGGFFIYKIQCILLKNFINIMDKYLNDEIELTEDQQKRCMIHINNIIKGNYWLII